MAVKADQKLTYLQMVDIFQDLSPEEETATQTLNEFKAGGLIDIGRKRINIVDPAGLALLAEE